MKEWISMKKGKGPMKETKNVDLNHLGNELKSKIELLDITPIGLNHLCHNNANLFKDKNRRNEYGVWI
jgi:hypothetical protein